MKKMSKIMLTCLAALTALTVTACGKADNKGKTAQKVDWPKKTVQITVGYAAGGDSDLYARTCAKYLTQKLKKDFVVVNTTGAGGLTGAISVMDSKPDGHTILFNHYGCLVQEATGSTSGVSFINDMAQGGSVLVDNSYTLCAKKSLGFKDWKDLVKYAKANPDKLTISANANSNGYDIVQQIENAAGIQLKQVEGSGSASARIAAILGGQHDLIYANYSLLKDYIKNGDLVVMGSIGTKRSSAHPDVPCLTELIGKPVVSPYIFSFRFPKKTDPKVIAYFDNVMKEICADPKFVEEIKKLGGNVVFNDGKSSLETQKKMLADTKARLGGK